jgi:hypothetical protein
LSLIILPFLALIQGVDSEADGAIGRGKKKKKRRKKRKIRDSGKVNNKNQPQDMP